MPDPQGIAYLISTALLLAGGRLFQIGTKQGRSLRRSYKRIEDWESYAIKLRSDLRRRGLPVRPYPKSLSYMNPPDEEEDDYEDEEHGGDHDEKVTQ